MDYENLTEEKAVAATPAAAPAAKPVAPNAAAPAEPAAPAENLSDMKVVAPEQLHEEMKRLHDEEKMDFLECLTGMDWETDGLGVIYHLESTETGKRVCLKTATTDREIPLLPSVTDLWDVANIYER